MGQTRILDSFAETSEKRSRGRKEATDNPRPASTLLIKSNPETFRYGTIMKETFGSRSRSASLIVVALAVAIPSGCAQISAKFDSFRKTASNRPHKSTLLTADRPKAELDQDGKDDVKMAVARSLEREGHTERAKIIYLEILRKNDSRSDAHHRLAVIYDKTEEPKKASQHYRKALKQAPDNAELLSDVGYSYYLKQQWKPAEAYLRKAIKVDPKSAQAHNNLGLLLAHTDREDESLAEFSKAGCSKAEARANLGFAMMMANNLEGAKGQFQMSLAADPASKTSQGGLHTVRTLLAKREQALSASSRPSTEDGTQLTLAGHFETEANQLKRPVARRLKQPPTRAETVASDSSPWPRKSSTLDPRRR